MERPEYRVAIARAKAVKSERFVGMTFGPLPPFAHRGVPEIVRMTSWSYSWALRTASSTSSKMYAGSNGSDGLAGRVLAARFHWTSSLMIEALACADDWTRAARLPTQRKLGSSWKPIHMRSAARAAGAVTAPRTNRAMTRRTVRLTGVSLKAANSTGALRESLSTLA